MKNKKLLVIMAHPDDAELLCFGTISRHLSLGGKVKILIATDGSKAGTNRLDETKAVFHNMDVEIECLNLEDGNVKPNLETNTMIRSVIMEYSPDCIITHYPDQTGVEHQDHTVIARCVISVISKAICNVEKLLLAEPLISAQTAFRPNYFVDITEWEEKKSNALKYHKSQSQKYYTKEDFLNWRNHFHSLVVPGKDLSRAYEAYEVFCEIVR